MARQSAKPSQSCPMSSIVQCSRFVVSLVCLWSIFLQLLLLLFVPFESIWILHYLSNTISSSDDHSSLHQWPIKTKQGKTHTVTSSLFSSVVLIRRRRRMEEEHKKLIPFLVFFWGGELIIIMSLHSSCARTFKEDMQQTSTKQYCTTILRAHL